MKTSKILLASVFFTFFPLIMTVLMTGCCGCKDRPVLGFYDIKQMLSISLSQDFTNKTVPYDNTQKIFYNTLWIGMQVSNLDYYAFNENIPNLGNSNLMACSCDQKDAGDDGTKEIIKNIKITSNNAFSIDLPAGADLSTKFDYYSYYKSYSYNNFNSLPNLAMPKPTDDFNDYRSFNSVTPLETFNNLSSTNTTKNASTICALKPNSAPTASKNHIFTIEYEHIDGEKFTFVTQNISFL